MPGDDAIEIAGVVRAVMPAGRYRVELQNGHQLVARVPRRSQSALVGIRPGSRLQLSLCPSDMSQGLVVEVLN
ncbi:MAG TPA: hypothetical protein DCY13_10470 [Verrucomicrobiales bacterium]|nr:hypothetical protein [Verrucomicrobiales bacterium]